VCDSSRRIIDQLANEMDGECICHLFLSAIAKRNVFFCVKHCFFICFLLPGSDGAVHKSDTVCREWMQETPGLPVCLALLSFHGICADINRKQLESIYKQHLVWRCLRCHIAALLDNGDDLTLPSDFVELGTANGVTRGYVNDVYVRMCCNSY
jgi:hypothetical protein